MTSASSAWSGSARAWPTTTPTATSTISRGSSPPGGWRSRRAARDDPNAAIFRDAAKRLRAARLDVVNLPSAGRIENAEGDFIPASYMNFYIGNAVVVVPQYGAANDRAAVTVVQALFPDRKAVGLRADHILTGGGSFHCISQQVPL